MGPLCAEFGEDPDVCDNASVTAGRDSEFKGPKKIEKKKLELKKFCYTEDSKTVDTKIQDII